MEIIKRSVIAFLGKPNVGKSTLFNALQQNVYAIVTNKPQTTRNYICSRLVLSEDKEVVFVDTPGFHNPFNKLDLFLNSEIKYILKNVNVGCMLIDPTMTLNDEDTQLLNHIKNFEIGYKILVVNKIDLAKQPVIDELVKQVQAIVPFNEVHYISALNKTNLQSLIISFEKQAIHEDIDIDFWKEPGDEFVAKEVVRQACLEQLAKEVPYGINIMVNEYTYNKDSNQLLIDADIYVEKDSQKAIVIGAKGQMIKSIGTKARAKLLEIYDCKVVLKLFVKIKKDWRNDDILVARMGYQK